MRIVLRPVDWAAVGFSVAALAFLVLWAVAPANSAWVEQWAPNISVEAASVAATILIVDRIVRRQELQQLRPRLEGAYREIGAALERFVDAVADDLERARPSTAPSGRKRTISLSSPELDQWLLRLSTEDAEKPPPLAKDGLPGLAHRARQLADKIATTASRDREILPPDLVAAIDELERHREAMLGGYLFLRDRLSWTEPLPREVNPLVGMIEETRRVIRTYRHHAERQWQEAERRRSRRRERMGRYRTARRARR